MDFDLECPEKQITILNILFIQLNQYLYNYFYIQGLVHQKISKMQTNY